MNGKPPETAGKTPLGFIDQFKVQMRGWMIQYRSGTAGDLQKQNKAEESFRRLVFLAAEQIIDILLLPTEKMAKEAEVRIFFGLLLDAMQSAIRSQPLVQEFQALLTAQVSTGLMEHFQRRERAVVAEAVAKEVRAQTSGTEDLSGQPFESLLERGPLASRKR